MATFRPPVGVDRMERNAKRAVATPGLRRWLRFDKSGRTSMLNADKHAIAQKTGVQVTVVHLISFSGDQSMTDGDLCNGQL